MKNFDIIGFDIGTGNLVCASQKDNVMETRSMRNMFYTMEPEMLNSSMLSGGQLSHIKITDDDGDVEKIAIIGQDAYDWCNALNATVRRPMQNGVITTKDFDALDVISLMVKELVGDTNGGYCVYSVPAQAIDVDIPPVLYHEKVFGKIFTSLGFKSEPMNEAMSVVFSECAKENFTAIGFSFGAGLTNVCLSFKGVPAITFSVSRGGDWIDNSVADSLGISSTKVTKVKEKEGFDLLDPSEGKKAEKRIREAITVYYENLINYVIKVFINEFNKKAEGVDLETEIPIIISGGTSKAGNFVELFKKVFEQYEDNFPFDISDIRSAEDPLSAVAKGNLIYANWKYTTELSKQKEVEEPVSVNPTQKKSKRVEE